MTDMHRRLYDRRQAKQAAAVDAGQAFFQERQRQYRFFAPVYELFDGLHQAGTAFREGPVPSGQALRERTLKGKLRPCVEVDIEGWLRLLIKIDVGPQLRFVGALRSGGWPQGDTIRTSDISALADWLADVVVRYEYPKPRVPREPPELEQEGRTRVIDLKDDEPC